MKKRVFTVAAIAVVVLLAAAYLWGPSAAPPGQQPVTVLPHADLHEFAAAFDRDAAVPRIVLLLSPT